MPWLNEGRQGNVVWQKGANPAGVCHYGNAWRDRYALVTRKRAVERIIDQAFPDGGSALDVGCGDGKWAEWLESRGWQVTGVDVARFGEYPRILADGEALPFPSGTFDVVLMITSLAHMQDQHAALNEAIRVADHLLLVEHLRSPLPTWLWNLPHRNPYTMEGLDAEMHLLGCVKLAVEGCGVVDQSLFVRTDPRWWRLMALLTWMIDAHLRGRRSANYRAVLYRKVRKGVLCQYEEAGRPSLS